MVLQVVGSLNSCELIYPIAEVDETLAMGYVDTRSDDMDKATKLRSWLPYKALVSYKWDRSVRYKKKSNLSCSHQLGQY